MKLCIVDDIVEMIGTVHRLSRLIARHDRNLARQLRDAATSVGLNSNEGLWARGGNRTNRLDSAMCSGREVRMALRIAEAASYLAPEVVAPMVDRVDKIVATLYKLSHRRRS